MISYIKGKIKIKNENAIILEVGDIGYQVFVSDSLLRKIQEGENIELFTHLHFREDIIALYGFNDMKELDFFKKLNKITGVGPKSALGILSGGKLDELKSSIISGRTELLTRVSGIGRKTAERIVLELKNNIKTSEIGDFKGNNNDQLRSALSQLGYKGREIEEALDKVPNEIEGLGKRIKEALKFLGK